jgi:hypothetical protein
MNPAAKATVLPGLRPKLRKFITLLQADVIRPAGLLRDLLGHYTTPTTKKNIGENKFSEPCSSARHRS